MTDKIDDRPRQRRRNSCVFLVSGKQRAERRKKNRVLPGVSGDQGSAARITSNVGRGERGRKFSIKERGVLGEKKTSATGRLSANGGRQMIVHKGQARGSQGGGGKAEPVNRKTDHHLEKGGGPICATVATSRETGRVCIP